VSAKHDKIQYKVIVSPVQLLSLCQHDPSRRQEMTIFTLIKAAAHSPQYICRYFDVVGCVFVYDHITGT